jgi:hypothetical protein
MELLLWLEQLYIWRLQREHASPKQEDCSQTEDKELPQASTLTTKFIHDQAASLMPV